MIGTKLGPYEITAKLGEGGMGEVYRATDTKLRRDVAIKVLPAAFTEDKERLARFEREAQLLAQLHHPNIASIFGLEESDGTRALVMELVDGPTLAERLESGSLPLNESLFLARQIAEALEEAHEKGIIHRDLKPQNIKASIEGKVKVLDFGLAKAMDPTGAASGSGSASQLAASPTLTLGATQMGVVLGTAAYMSPEQAKGLAVDKRADIWAFGVVLYEMLTGRRLFEGDSVPETLAGVLKNEIDLGRLPAEVPAAIRNLLRRCLERQPRARLRDIGDARIAIEEALDPRGVVEPAAAPVARGAASRLPWAVAAVCAAIAAGALLVLVLGRGSVTRTRPAAPTRTSILLPGSADGSIFEFALAPDGDALVFVTADEAGKPHLLARELDAAEARPLEGTEGARYPFWSADSRHVGFFAGGELRRVPRAGGAVQTICAARNGRGGAWSRDGTIVFAPEPFGPLWKVRASGGEPSAATVTEVRPNRQASHRFPTFLPDGRHFLFLETGTESLDSVRVASIDETTAGRRLFDSSSSPRLAPPDWIVFESAGAMVAQRIDLDRLQMIGEPRLLVDRPKLDTTTSGAAVVDLSIGGRMLYAPRDLRPSRLSWLDRAGQPGAGESKVEGVVSDLSISHRGDRVVLMSRTSDSHTALWLVDAGRSAAVRITAPELLPWTAAWSADDRSILSWVGRFQTGSSAGSPSLVSVDGGAVHPLLPTSSRWILPTDVSADGKVLLLWELTTGRGRDIVWMRLDTGGDEKPETSTYLATPANESGGKLSPDGRWVAYLSDASGRQEAYLDRFPTPAGAQRIGAGGTASEVSFRSDGRELFVRASDGGADAVFACDLRLGERAEVGPPRRLFRLPADDSSFAAAPSGDRFLIAEPEGELWPSLTLVDNWTAQLAPER